mmetsp:Transcript_88667/g.169980  ORF Transcript_88667/g.169980 Transcript_88667/m.169980 type:complete len:497 (+) Transcript_88667:147-1637(+)
MKVCNFLSTKSSGRACAILFQLLNLVGSFSPYSHSDFGKSHLSIYNKAAWNHRPCKSRSTLSMSDADGEGCSGWNERTSASRRTALQALGAAALLAGPLPVSASALSSIMRLKPNAQRLVLPLVPSGAKPKAQKIVLPLVSNGAAFCTEYFIGGRRFRAVVDTGSPFLLVNGIRNSRQTWGYFEDNDGSMPIGDSSEVDYGGEDVDVEWRRGSLLLAGYANSSEVAATEFNRQSGAWSMLWTQMLPGARSDIQFEPINFGVVRRSKGYNGAGAIYLGMAKTRRPDELAKGSKKEARIRPTFLEQTDIQSLQFNFIKRTLTLARKPLLPRKSDAVPLVDLIRLGAPLAFYAFKVHRLTVNGHELVLRKPCVAVIDTGVTGMLVSEALYESKDEAPAGDWRSVRTINVETLTEKNHTVTFAASQGNWKRTADDATSSSRTADFPLLVLPVEFERLWKGRTFQAEGEQLPHFIILGLAFLSKMKLTIDVDKMRLAAEEV